MTEIKEELDKLNYGKTLRKLQNDLELSIDKDYCATEMTTVRKIFDTLSGQLLNSKDKESYHVGVISSGTHSEDYASYYGFEKELENADWHNDPVMYVYECPADNSAWSFANNSPQNTDSSNFTCYTRSKNTIARNAFLNFSEETDSINFESHLCRCLWHVDYSLDYSKSRVIETKLGGDGSFNYFGDKEYGRFMLSLIREFKLSNFYTTNLFRYEIFKVGKDKNNIDVEIPLNLPNITKAVFHKEKMEEIRPDSDLFSVFMEELELLSPKVIFATSNPYVILNNWKSMDLGDEKISNILKSAVLVKVPHPANRDSYSSRYIKNVFNITKGLHVANIINTEEQQKLLQKAFEVYCKSPE